MPLPYIGPAPASAPDVATKGYADSVGGGATATNDTPPGSPTDGTQWWDSTTGKFYIYYNDGTSSQWVEVGINGAPGDWSTAQVINAQTGTTYTVVAGDLGKLVTLTNAAAITVTIPSGLGLVAGQRISFGARGAGQPTFVGSGATVNGTPGLKLRAQYSYCDLLCISTNVYDLVGDLSA